VLAFLCLLAVVLTDRNKRAQRRYKMERLAIGGGGKACARALPPAPRRATPPADCRE
jgi:hypothetical protein